jgi:hypothetical protein
MHPSVARAIQEIDAAVFNGDTFEEPEARKELQEYIERWSRRLAEPIITGDTDDDDDEEED